MKETIERIRLWAVPALVVLLLLFIAGGIYQTERLREKLRDANRNIEALTDTMHRFQTMSGELVEWNKSLVADKETLRDSLYKENLSKKELEKNLSSKIVQLSKIISEFHSDTITVTDTVEVLKDGEFAAPFQYKDDFLTLSGKTLFSIGNLSSSTTIDGLSVRVPLTIGTTEDGKVFVHSQNPDVAIVMMNSLSLEKKDYNKRRIGIGIYAGFGMQYGLIGKTIDTGPQVGIGVYWRLF